MIPGYLSRQTSELMSGNRSAYPPIVTGYLDSISNHVGSLTAYDKPDLFLGGVSDKEAYLNLTSIPDTNLDGFVVRFKDPKSGRDAVGSIVPRVSNPLPISNEGGKVGVNLGNSSTLVDLGLNGGNTFLPVVLGSTSFGEASTSEIYNADQVSLLSEAAAVSEKVQTNIKVEEPNTYEDRVRKATGQSTKSKPVPDLESSIFTKESLQKKRDQLKTFGMNDVIPATGYPLPKTTLESKNSLKSNSSTATSNKYYTPVYVTPVRLP